MNAEWCGVSGAHNSAVLQHDLQDQGAPRAAAAPSRGALVCVASYGPVVDTSGGHLWWSPLVVTSGGLAHCQLLSLVRLNLCDWVSG